MYRRPDS